MYRLYFISFIVVTTICRPPDCDGGSFKKDNSGKCMFQCESSGDYVQISSLSFNFIAQQCDQVRYAAERGLCSNVDDLIYSNSACECPYCSCDTDGSESVGSIMNSFEIFLEKSCVKCTCGDDPSLDDLVYQCDKIASVYDPYNWNDFSCVEPAVVCTDAVSGTEFQTGESWFAAKHNDTYCYCDGDGTSICETGFDSIVRSTHNALVSSFYRHYEYALTDCIDEPQRILHGTLCDCGTHSVGDKWFKQYFIKQYSLTCHECSCTDSGYTDCLEIYLYSDSITCPGSSSISCHSDANDISTSVTTRTLNRIQCQTDAPEAWCQWSFEEPEALATWDCDQEAFCGIYATNGQCVYGEYTVDYTDCDGALQTASGKQYIYCCNYDYCNFKDFDITRCYENTKYSALWQQFYQCMYSNHVILECDSTQQNTTCDALEESYRKPFDCFCTLYTNAYYDASSEWKPRIQQRLNTFRYGKFGNLMEWNDVLGCDISLQCDIISNPTTTTETETTNAALSIVSSKVIYYDDIGIYKFEFDTKSSAITAQLQIHFTYIPIAKVTGSVTNDGYRSTFYWDHKMDQFSNTDSTNNDLSEYILSTAVIISDLTEGYCLRYPVYIVDTDSVSEANEAYKRGDGRNGYIEYELNGPYIEENEISVDDLTLYEFDVVSGVNTVSKVPSTVERMVLGIISDGDQTESTGVLQWPHLKLDRMHAPDILAFILDQYDVFETVHSTEMWFDDFNVSTETFFTITTSTSTTESAKSDVEIKEESGLNAVDGGVWLVIVIAMAILIVVLFIFLFKTRKDLLNAAGDQRYVLEMA